MRITFFIFCLTVTCCKAFSQSLSVDHLTCEYKINPLGIESASPKLSWQLKSTQRSVLQTAYRILIADDSMLLKKNNGNVWDSKKMTSDQSINVSFAGSKLQPTRKYYWKVMVWDNKKNISAWSKMASWQMGLINKDDWKNAQWIAYEKIPDSLIDVLPIDGKKDTYKGNNILPLLRKSFSVKKKVKQATMFICGLGQFELHINGKKIGDHFLDPGWTKYDKQALYVPFDVTDNLRQGDNAMGVMLGNGFYYIPPVSGRYRKLKVAFGFPKMICRLVIEYSDGSIENILSDASWKTSPSPITFSSIYGGEDYDARLEQKNWDNAAFNDGGWKEAIVVDGPPSLNAQLAEPVKIMHSLVMPSEKFKLSDGSWVYDMGQNLSGIPQITISGKKGDTIRIFPGELLRADSSVNQRGSGGPYYLQYILEGEGHETWQPRFTYYGFRYLQIKGVVERGEPNPNGLPMVVTTVKTMHIRNSAGSVGNFYCSKNLFNATYSLIDWAIRSNMASVFTDCPHREKLGWLEEAHLMGNSIRYNYDVVNLYRKQVMDMQYSQTDSGLVPEIAPEYVRFDWGGGMFRDSPEWGSNAIITPWDVYKWYGDKEILAQSYGMMKRYIDYLQSKAKGNILYQGLGDWYDLGPNPPGVSQLTPMGVTATAIYYYDLTIMSDVANLLNKEEDAATYKKLGVEVRQAFNDSFFHKETNQYATGSQTANAMAVFTNLVDPQNKESVIANIVKDIRDRNNAFTAGDIGYHYLVSVLQDAGRDDVIYDMNNNSEVPGYGYQLAKGATALTESWQALPANSNNHLMLGHLMEWFYSGLGGIKQDETSIAFRNIVIDPRVVGNVNDVNTSYQSIYGGIELFWQKEITLENQISSLHILIHIPENTSATIYLPSNENAKITERNKPLQGNPDVKWIGYENGKAIMKIGSGKYVFDVKNFE